MKKGSKAAKAWGAKMRRLRNGKKTKTKKRKRSTRKYGVRKTARRAYVGLKKRKTRRKRLKFPSKREELDAWSF